MRHALTAILLLTGATATAAAVLMVAGVPELLEQRPEKQAAPNPAAPAKGAWSPQDEKATGEAVRPVAPGVVASPPGGQRALVREAPRPALGPLGMARAPEPEKPAEPKKEFRYFQLLHQPVATAAGRIEAGGHRIRLRGIEVRNVDEACTTGSGAEKPCGMMARTAFRNWLRGRSIMCSVTAVPSPDEIETDCMVGGEDMAAWLVAQGWTEAAQQGGELAALQSQAASARRGLHGL